MKCTILGTGKEALKVDQSLIREDQTQTQEWIGRFDRANGFLKALLIARISMVVSILIATIGAVWSAGRISQAVEGHERRIEKIEGDHEGRADLQRSIDRIPQTLDARRPASAK